VDANSTLVTAPGVKLNAQWFGMSPSESAANNTTAFHHAVAAMVAQSTLWIPTGTYSITNLIFDPPGWCSLECGKAILRATDSTGTAFYIGDPNASPESRTNYRVSGLTVDDLSPDWTADRVGIKIVNCYNGIFDIVKVNGFEKGIFLFADNSKGCVYNKIQLGKIFNSKYNIYCDADNNGWCNQNTFYDGELGWTATNNGGDSGFDEARDIYIAYNAADELHNIQFYSPSFEGADTDIYGQAKCAFIDGKWCDIYSPYHGLKDFASTQSVITLTQAAGTATCTIYDHNYDSGDLVQMAGANEYQYNDNYIITVTDANIFTFTVASDANSPATGTITAANSKYPFEYGSNSEYCHIFSGGQLTMNDIEDSGTGNMFITRNKIDGINLDSYNYDEDAGGDDAYVANISGFITTYKPGLSIYMKVSTANTGACTLSVNSLHADAIKMLHDQDPADNYIEAGSIIHVIHDGINWQLQTPDCNP